MVGIDQSTICVYYIDNLARVGRGQVHMEELVFL